jgi:hypothetical protein
MNIFEHCNFENVDLNNPDFENIERIHDWRNYVPDEWRPCWNDFTNVERQIIFVMANIQAENEEWE